MSHEKPPFRSHQLREVEINAYDRNCAYFFDNRGKLVADSQTITGMETLALGFDSVYLYRKRRGREIAIQLTGGNLFNKENAHIGFSWAHVWIPKESDKAKFEFIPEKDGKLKALPVIRNSFRLSYNVDTFGRKKDGKSISLYLEGTHYIDSFDETGEESWPGIYPLELVQDRCKPENEMEEFVQKYFPRTITVFPGRTAFD